MKQEASIKTSLRIVFLYILVLVLGIVVSAALYTVYTLCKNMIAGGGLKVFNLGYFVTGINVFSPLVVIAAGLVMILYLIRYSIRKILPFNLFVIAYIAVWVFLLPLNYSVVSKISTTTPPTETAKTLTSDYFRTGKTGNVFYYSSIVNENTADGICIDKVDESTYTFNNVVIPRNEGFSDSLIHKSIGMPSLIETMLSWAKMFFNIARQAWESGFLGWLCFASISLALASTAGLSFISKWRMVNVLSVCIVTVGILVLNILAYTKSFMDPARVFLEGAMSNIPIKNPLIVLMNVLIFVILSLLGFIVQNKRRKEDKALYADPYGKEFA